MVDTQDRRGGPDLRFLSAALGLLLVSVAACTQLPAQGPSTTAVVGGPTGSASLDYTLIPVDERVLDILDARPRDSLAGSFGGATGGTSERIGVGDIVAVTIWEAANGGLFSTSSGSLGGGTKTASIPAQPVSSDGTILVPYAGAVAAEGRTPGEVKASIEAALAGKAIEPQVLVSVERSITNRVTVTGDASGGGVVPLTARGTRVLDAVAVAGPLKVPTDTVMVELVRGSRSASVPLKKVISNPAENVFLRADDVVSLTHQPQMFTAIGATSRNTVIEFPLDGMTLDQAIAKAGGLLDLRADPAGVFVFRFEHRGTVRAIDPAEDTRPHRDRVPTVYRVDLRDPNGLFSAKRFEVVDGDLVYIANASLSELQKFALIIGSFTSPAIQVQRIVDN
jgi:polysaccharide export outer membrane protein